MAVPISIVDAFTARPFAGNPAAVCLLPGPRDPSWMQAVAAEMNLSETAFLHPEGDGYRLRWFTPVTEVDLCGHATLASAHVLFKQILPATAERIVFFTNSGELTATLEDRAILLDFPAEPATPTPAPAGLVEALGVTPVSTGKNRFDYLIEVASGEEVIGMSPDFTRLAAVPMRGVIVTAASTGAYDFVSRFFAPAVGVNEDPVTGSAHCCLGPYWKEVLGKETLSAYQASKRGGELSVRVAGDRVVLGGRAVTVLEGSLCG
jgi:PhzF family phenazine biosynthesis protein